MSLQKFNDVEDQGTMPNGTSTSLKVDTANDDEDEDMSEMQRAAQIAWMKRKENMLLTLR